MQSFRKMELRHRSIFRTCVFPSINLHVIALCHAAVDHADQGDRTIDWSELTDEFDIIEDMAKTPIATTAVEKLHKA